MPPPDARPNLDRSQAALVAALTRFRQGEELQEAAAAEGVAAWQLLEAAQAMPAPGAAGLDGSDLEPFVRRR